MKWLRIAGLYLLLWSLAAGGLWWLTWWAWSPVQRAYVRPALEAAVGAWVSVPPARPVWSPSVNARLVDPVTSTARWMTLPAPQMAAALRPLYPLPVAVIVGRVLVVAAVEAPVLQMLLLLLARVAARSRLAPHTPSRAVSS